MIRLLPFQDKKKRWVQLFTASIALAASGVRSELLGRGAFVRSGTGRAGTFFAQWCRNPDPSVLLNTHLMPSGALLARRLFADAFPGDGRLQLASLDHLRRRSQRQ